MSINKMIEQYSSKQVNCDILEDIEFSVYTKSCDLLRFVDRLFYYLVTFVDGNRMVISCNLEEF